MPSPNNESPKKLVFNDALLQAFINGTLEPPIEQKVAAYLDARPELLAKVASNSGELFLNRMKSAKLQSVPNNANEVDITQNGAAIEPKAVPLQPSADKSVPSALANYAGYKVTKELGRGGMGVVYLAKNIQMDRLEVLKVLNERLLDHEGAKERFLREVRAVSKLNHPNIVTSYSILPLDQLMVFAMEHVHGMDLHKFIQKHKPLPIGLACSFARQLALGLQHAHERGLVHRDIKPSNAIVYKADGQLQLKILDFGLAKASSEKRSDGLTQDGTMLGTPEYMSPEQTLNASKADIRADIYSLGCTLYAMLTSSPPFTGTHGEIMMAHAQREAPTVNLKRPEVPIELAAVVSKMMAKDISKRFQVPAEVAVALQPFVGRSYGASQNQPVVPLEAPGTVNDLNGPDRETSVEKQREMSLDYASIDSEKPALSLEEILKRPKPAATQLRAAKRKTQSRRSKNGWIAAIVANLVLLPLTLWMAGVFSVKTPDGTIVFDKLPKDADVFVDGNKVQVTWNEGKDRATVTASAGERAVKILRGSDLVQGEKVMIKQGEECQLVVKWKEILGDDDIEREPAGNSESSQLVEGQKLSSFEQPTVARSKEPQKIAVGNSARIATVSSKANWWIDRSKKELVQDNGGWDNWIFFGDREWKDYRFSFKACKTDGVEKHGSFSAYYRSLDEETNHRWEFGSFAAAKWSHVIYKSFGKRLNAGNSIIRSIPRVDVGRWYQIEVTVLGDKFECMVDGSVFFNYSSNQISRGCIGLNSGVYPCRFRDIMVTTPNGDVLWEGLPDLPVKGNSIDPDEELLLAENMTFEGLKTWTKVGGGHPPGTKQKFSLKITEVDGIAFTGILSAQWTKDVPCAGTLKGNTIQFQGEGLQLWSGTFDGRVIDASCENGTLEMQRTDGN
jgi:serine/threonine protein kinase